MIGVGVLTAVFFGVDEVAALLVGGVVAAVGLMVAMLIDLGRQTFTSWLGYLLSLLS